MEIINFRAVERSTQDVSVTINNGDSKKWAIQSQKTKYVNGKMSGVTGVEYTASINNSNYLLEEDKSNNEIQITANAEDTSGLCVLTQNGSGNKINLNITTPEEGKAWWEIHFKPIPINGVDTGNSFASVITINGEVGSMSPLNSVHRNWIINQDGWVIDIYISKSLANGDLLSWSCLDKNGNAFSPAYNRLDNQYFTIRKTDVGSYTLQKISSPSTNNGTIMISSRFNPTKKYPLDLNFYWGMAT